MPYLRWAVIPAALLIASSGAQAQRSRGLHVQLSQAPSNNGSDNGGVNTGSSSGTTGNTFAPPPGSSGVGGAPPPSPSGIGVTTSGNVGGAITTPPGQIIAGLQSGQVTITTEAGGTITVSLPAVTGQTLAAAITAPSPAAGQAAGKAVAQTLAASHVPASVVAALSTAVSAIGSSGDLATSLPAIAAAASSVQGALAAGQLTPPQAQDLVAVLATIRTAVASRP